MLVPPTIPPIPNGIVLVGEAPGEDEERVGMPFIGASGQELTQILKEAGIDRNQVYITNVFQERPPNNKLLKWTIGSVEFRKLYPNHPLPNPIQRGHFFHPKYLDSLFRLRNELLAWKPTIAIALGGTAAWALLGNSAISSIRGTTAESTLVPGLKVLSTFHPAYILRQWGDRSVMVADLLKARREMQSPHITRTQRRVWIEPGLNDLCEVSDKILSAEKLSVDIETAGRTITCIGFAWSPNEAIVVPFVDRRKPDFNYWPTKEHERFVYDRVKIWLQSPVPKLFQNGLYDITYIWKVFGYPPRNCSLDTMLRHHSHMPEMQKSLGFLGSIYTSEAPWKLMRHSSKEALKKDD